MIRVSVMVQLNPDVVDAAGQTVAARLRDQGFPQASNVRIGKLIQVDMETADQDGAIEQVKTMCEKMLANSLSEEFEVVAVEEIQKRAVED